jgi:hypothetical protein
MLINEMGGGKNHSHKRNITKHLQQGRTHKNFSYTSGSFPAFFQKNFSSKSSNLIKNTAPKLKTLHKSFYPVQKRVIVIGDIHGDFDKLIQCLVLAKCIKLPENGLPKIEERNANNMFSFIKNIKWTGGNTFVVQVGDQVDRIRPTDWDKNNVPIGNTRNDEGSSLHIFYLLWFLNTMANPQGGRIISLLGNHEFMNIDGDFRYVSPHEFNEYNLAFSKFFNSTDERHNDIELNEQVKQETDGLQNIPPGYFERRVSFHPSGIMSNFFALNYKTILQVGSWIFMHAGLTPSTYRVNGKYMNICKINNCISRYLATNDKSGEDYKVYKQVIKGDSDNSPVWNRDFGEQPECQQERQKLQGKLDLLLSEYNRVNKGYHKNGVPSAKRIAVGHTPQFWDKRGINGEYNDKVWRCDVGMSRAFNSSEEDDTKNEYRRPQVLEILNDDEMNVLS